MEIVIKFRGKRIYNGMWMEGDLKTDLVPKGSMLPCPAISTTKGTIGTFFVKTDTVGQFTGLTDKNGREIYEGDIIKFHFMTSSPSTSELFPTKKFFGEITTNKYNQWTILSDGLEIHIENAIKYGEIIGNIYDNKELLED